MHTELHLHTDLSLLDGLNTPKEYFARAAELGMTHLAITDHGTLSGHREFQRAAKAAGITPILGVEAYISATTRFDRRSTAKRDDSTQAFNHIGLLAQNETGLRNLNKLSEIAWTEGFYSKPRIDLDALEEYNEGVIALSGCMNGLISKAIEKEQMGMADQYMMRLKDILGDRFFVEVQGHNPIELNKALLELASKHKVLPVVTSDCHYARKEDLWREEAMLILSMNPTWKKGIDFAKSQKMEILDRLNYLYPDRKMTFQEIEIFLRSFEDHRTLLARQGIGDQPIKNTMVVAGMVGDVPYYEGLNLLPAPKTDDPDSLLEKKVRAGLKTRGFAGVEEYEHRIKEELQVIKDKQFSAYFLIVANAVQWAKSKGIRVGPGRGSAAGSLVCYALSITNVDPIKYNLLSFRFINPERNDWPDIDVDFQDSRRGEVKDYMRRQYKHVASIATFGTFQGKRAVRDASRVFMVPLGDVNKALKGADWPSNMDFFKLWLATDRGSAFAKKYPEVIDLAKYLLGRTREQGMHAGGLVVSKEPISNYAPMQSVSDPNDKSAPRIPLVALDMDAVADVGLIKQDFLGLKSLSVLQDTVDMVKERYGKEIILEDLEFTDKRVYETLSEGYTKGIFQCEQPAYTGLLIKMGGVKNFEELVASNALVRPGAAKSTAGQAFIDRKMGKAKPEYHHPDMEWFTKETYGVVIYQEQVMLTMTELAGMSMSEADKVRKIIGKKRDVSEFEEYKTRFVEGASKKASKEIAEGLWHDFEAHAGYSFNKSHAVAYSMLTYWTAWLKVNYPLEFMCAVLRNEGDKDALLDYLIETKRLGLRVLLPHVNDSDVRFSIQNKDGQDFLRFGLSNIKYISGKLATRLIEHRPYKNYSHLYSVVDQTGSGLNSRVLTGLNAIGGAFFPDNPRTGNERDNFYEYLSIPAFEQKDLPPKMKVQFRPLDEFSENEAFVSMGMVRKVKTGDGWARVDMVDETGSAGVFADEHTPIESGQMYVFLISNNRIARFISTDDLIEGRGGSFRQFLEATEFPDIPDGMVRVVSFHTRITKAGKRMADVVFADNEKNLIPALVWPSGYPKAFSKCNDGAVLDVQFRETDDGAIFVHNIL